MRSSEWDHVIGIKKIFISVLNLTQACIANTVEWFKAHLLSQEIKVSTFTKVCKNITTGTCNSGYNLIYRIRWREGKIGP